MPLENAYCIKPPKASADFMQLVCQDLRQSSGKPPELDHSFLDTCKKRFLWYLESYKMAIQKGLNNEHGRSHQSFPQMPFEHAGNTMTGTWNYNELQKRLETLETCIMEETEKWPKRGYNLVSTDAPLAASLRAQFDQILVELTRRTDGMVTLELVDDNPFLWRLIYHGRPMTQYDGGVLKVKIYISPNHPAEQPRVLLETPLYHVRVSPLNVLIYLPLQADEMSRHVDGIINSLEEEKPPVNPMMTVNPEASALCWGSPEEQRQYRRKLRRSVAATLE